MWTLALRQKHSLKEIASRFFGFLGSCSGPNPTPLCSSPSVLQIYLVFNWSILNIDVKTHLFFEFRFAAFPGKTIRLSITGKSPATLILAGGHS